MTNDAKLGMLVGVIGVVFAAVFLAPPTQSVPAEQQAQPTAVSSVPADSAGGVVATSESRGERKRSEFPSTPVVRTRQEVGAVPVSLQSVATEEP